jgi:hypothetical protein
MSIVTLATPNKTAKPTTVAAPVTHSAPAKPVATHAPAKPAVTHASKPVAVKHTTTPKVTHSAAPVAAPATTAPVMTPNQGVCNMWNQAVAAAKANNTPAVMISLEMAISVGQVRHADSALVNAVQAVSNDYQTGDAAGTGGSDILAAQVLCDSEGS